MYNLHYNCLMKCLNEFFIDCLISYSVNMKQWTICSAFKYVSTLETLICSRFGTCHAKGYEWSTEWNRQRTQPWRHKEGGWRSVCMSQFNLVRQDNAHRRWLGEEHVLRISSAPHVPGDWDGCYVAEIAWIYSQNLGSATRLCLGSIIIM